jgi:formiminotetrahydrofolate cyclodeaminase
LAAGRHYLAKQGRSTGVSESELVTCAVQSLGLSDVVPFAPQNKIIEYRLLPAQRLLRDLSLSDFVDELSSESPAPGGGSTAALAGALSAALSAMVANLTYGRAGFESKNAVMNDTAEAAQRLKAVFVKAVDEDAGAFNDILTARRLPKDSQENQQLRNEAIARANKEATLVPLSVLENSIKAVALAQRAATDGNPNALSDAGVAGALALAAAQAAFYNVFINLPSITDEMFAADVRGRANQAWQVVQQQGKVLHEQVADKLTSSGSLASP